MKKSIKKFLPYTIIYICAFYVLPFLEIQTFGSSATKDTVSIFLGLFVIPTACIIMGIIYGNKYGFDWFFVPIAPVIYLPSCFLFYDSRDLFSALSYIFIYAFTGIVGLGISDMIRAKSGMVAVSDEELKEEASEEEFRENEIVEEKFEPDATDEMEQFLKKYASEIENQNKIPLNEEHSSYNEDI
ncbi:MAG: hypothetical protein Q8876_03335 [Bacillota bacterium]|nr:hypothetical protein [Bacillota bacterium]